jgi:N-acetylglucosaminyldiphosphoundecaprenol N-acetyl-beta-D-mannosaminyltransferase
MVHCEIGRLPRDPTVPEAPASPGWINLLGIRVSAVNLTSAAECILGAIAAGRREYVCIRDAHGVIRSQEDAELREAHNRAFLVTPDGMPLVWALRQAGHTDADRVYGPDLMLRLFDQGRSARIRHFLLGSTPEVLADLQRNLCRRFPGARVVGSHAPPFRSLAAEEDAAELDAINASGADIVWVGLGSPKQELWMARARDRLEPAMLIGVGAAFDFHAGRVRQAPRMIQRSGLEWSFRLACEPRRLWRRYATTIPRFLYLVLVQSLGLREFPEPSPSSSVPESSRRST